MNIKNWQKIWMASEPWQRLSWLRDPAARKVIQELALEALPDQTGAKNCHVHQPSLGHEKTLIMQKCFVFETLLELFINQTLGEKKRDLQMALLSLCSECFTFGQMDYTKKILRFIANSNYDFVEAHKNRKINISTVREFTHDMAESINLKIVREHYSGDSRDRDTVCRQDSLFKLYDLATRALVKIQDWEQLAKIKRLSAIPYLTELVGCDGFSTKSLAGACDLYYMPHATSVLLRLIVIRNDDIRSLLESFRVIGNSDPPDHNCRYDDYEMAPIFARIGVDYPNKLIGLDSFKLDSDGNHKDQAESFKIFKESVEVRIKCVIECLELILKESAILLGLYV